MADTYQVIIRALHIMSGVMWVGGIFLWSMVIAPNVSKNAPPAIRGPFMKTVLGPISRYFSIAGVITVLTGFWTMGIIVGFSNLAATFQTGAYGIALGVGVVVALVMLGLAFGFIVPTANKLLAMMDKMPAPAAGAAPSPPPAEAMALQKKLMQGAMVNMLLGVVALVVMAIAVSERSGL